jgi:hypothetical protein
MDAPFPQFAPSSPDGPREFRITEFIALVPLYVSLVLMAAQPQDHGRGLWFVCAFALGLNMLLYGIRQTCFDKAVRYRWGAWLSERCDRWLPWCAFLTRSGSIAMTAFMFWALAVQHGLPATFWQHMNATLLIGVFFVFQFAKAMAVFNEDWRWHSAAELARYVGYTLTGLLAGSIVTLFVAPPGQRIPWDQQIFVALLWIGVLLVPVVCALLWANHMLNRKAAESQAGPR